MIKEQIENMKKYIKNISKIATAYQQDIKGFIGKIK